MTPQSFVFSAIGYLMMVSEKKKNHHKYVKREKSF